ncbi:dipeptidase [Planctomycetota bacterium]
MTPVWDCHSDVLLKLLEEARSSFVEGRGEGPERHYDLDRIVRGGVGVLVCALFNRDDACGASPVVRTLRMIDAAWELQFLTEKRVELACDGADIDRILTDGRTCMVLSIENAIACLDRLDLLRTYYRLGVRAVGVTWNGRNFAADGCGVEETGSRLTSFGRELVREAERLGMVLDVSHLSDSCFWDLLEHVSMPVIASHSNVRALCDHRRNLDDDQIRAIAERGGVIGLNFYGPFLTAEDGDRATVDDVVRHALGLLERVGPDHVGIGSDFDGIKQGPEGLEDPTRFPALRKRLAHEGVAEKELERIFFGNFRRVFGQVMG